MDNITQQKELLSINCSLITLNGKKNVYTIKNDSIYSFGKKELLPVEEVNIIKNFPKEILIKNRQYGCGICVDGVDFEFIFQFNNSVTKYKLQPNSTIPNQIKPFFEFLTKKYKNIVTE